MDYVAVKSSQRPKCPLTALPHPRCLRCPPLLSAFPAFDLPYFGDPHPFAHHPAVASLRGPGPRDSHERHVLSLPGLIHEYKLGEVGSYH